VDGRHHGVVVPGRGLLVAPPTCRVLSGLHGREQAAVEVTNLARLARDHRNPERAGVCPVGEVVGGRAAQPADQRAALLRPLLRLLLDRGLLGLLVSCAALHFFRPHVPVEQWWQRTHHLHLTETTSTLWRERLAFRDALRNNRDLLQQYQNLKEDLAADHVDGEHYTAGKHDFVRRVLASVGVPLVDWRAAPASREV